MFNILVPKSKKVFSIELLNLVFPVSLICFFTYSYIDPIIKFPTNNQISKSAIN
jgi:hypothetical protein